MLRRRWCYCRSSHLLIISEVLGLVLLQYDCLLVCRHVEEGVPLLGRHFRHESLHHRLLLCTGERGELGHQGTAPSRPRSHLTQPLPHELLQHEMLNHELLQHELLKNELLQHELLKHELLQHELLQHELLKHDLLEHDLEQVEADQSEKPLRRLEVISSEAQRLSRLIGNVLTFARQQRKGSPPDAQAV